MNVQRYSVFFGLLLILSTVSVLCFGEVVEKSFQDFDKLTRVCTETDNWCKWANRQGKAIIYGETRAFEHLEEIMDKYHNTFDVLTDFLAGGNHGAPGGWMGTPVGINLLKVEPRWNSNCYNGLTCFKNIWETTSTIDWVGIYWLEPDNNWGQIPNAGFDLTGATQVTFYARGEEGGEPVEFLAGGVTGDYPDSIQPKASTGRIRLTQAWKKYTIDLSGKDLTHVISPFGWTVAIDPIFYIDDVQYDLPRPNALRFLQSYEILDIDTEIAIANAAHVYDNALALLAFLARGTEDDLRRAKILADALVFVLNNDRHYTDGRLRNVYMSGDLAESVTGMAKLPGWWDTEKQAWFEDEYSVSTHTGNIAWAMLALLGYYEKMGGEKYLEAVKTMGEWLEKETKDERGAGGYTGGYKGWEQTDKNPTPPQKLLYKATEHNIDLYPVFMRLYRITKETKWLESAKHAKNFVEAMWNAQEGHFWTGSTENGVDINQDNIPVDVQAWAVMAIPAENRYRAGLQWAEQNCYLATDGFKGFDFNNDLDGVWFEGTAQMALAYQINQEKDKSDLYISELRKAQVSASNNNGKGIIAASHDGVSTGFDWEYFSRLHVGATAWFLFAEMGYNPYWNSFNSDEGLVQVEAMGLKSPYAVGDTVQIDLVEITHPRSERVDLWEAIELSTGEFLFKAPPMSFSLTQQAVKTSIENTETTHRLLDFVVPEGISGHYTLYTAYVQQGENPVTNNSSIRSNLVILPITLENR